MKMTGASQEKKLIVGSKRNAPKDVEDQRAVQQRWTQITEARKRRSGLHAHGNRP